MPEPVYYYRFVFFIIVALFSKKIIFLFSVPFFLFFFLFILTGLGLHFSAWATPVEMCGPLTEVDFLVAKHGL